MKRVLISFEWLHMGGTEKFVLDAIKLLPSDEYQVDLFLIHEEGPYLQYLPPNVRLVCPFKIGREEFNKRYAKIKANSSAKACLKQKKCLKAVARMIANKFDRDRLRYYKSLLNEVDTSLKYDIVIGASMTQMFSTAVAALVNADRKFLWVHMPFGFERSKEHVYFNVKRYSKYVYEFDGIICVSNGIEQMVRKAMPDYPGFVVTIYNYIDKADIKEKAKAEIPEALRGDTKIVSVGRVVSQKGFDIAVDAANILKKNGKQFVWYIIGEGKDRQRSIKRADELGLSEYIVFLGRRDNPYPYIKMCDIYCQPSRFEAYCITVNEALILEKPIVATNFTGISEQVANGVNGLIVQKNAKSIADGLEKLFDPEYRAGLARNVGSSYSFKSGDRLDSGYMENLIALAENNLKTKKEQSI